MKKNIKHALVIAIAVSIIMMFAGCAVEDDFFVDDDQTIITISNIPATYNNVYVTGGLGDINSAGTNNMSMAFSYPTRIKDGTVILEMYKQDNKKKTKPASVSGAAIVVLILETTPANKNLHIPTPKNVKPGSDPSNTFDFDDFQE